MLHFTPAELQDHVEKGNAIVLLDVREPWEYEYVHLEDSLFIPLGQLPGRLAALDPGITIAVLCHHGIRSAYACEFLEQQGFDTINISGGIDLWARELDSNLSVY